MLTQLRRLRLRLLAALALLVLALFGMWALFLRPRVLHTAQPVNVAVFSPDGKVLATGHTVDVLEKNGAMSYGGGEIQLRDIRSGLVMRTYSFFKRITNSLYADDSGGPVGWLAFSPDGRMLLAGSEGASLMSGSRGPITDDKVGLLNIADGRWRLSLQGPFNEDEGTTISFLPIGFSRDSRRAFFLRSASLHPSTRHSTDAAPVSHVPRTYSITLVTCDCATGRIIRNTVCGLQPRERIAQAVLLSDGVTIAMSALSLDAKGNMLGSDKLVFIDSRTGKPLCTLKTEHVNAHFISASAAPVLAQWTFTGTVLWDMHSPIRQPFSQKPTILAYPLALSPNGKIMAGLSFNYHLCLWSLPHCALIRVLDFHPGLMNWQCAFSPDGKWLAQPGPGNVVNLYRVW